MVCGMFRGFFMELAAMGGIVLGVIAARIWGDALAAHIMRWLTWQQATATAMAYCAIFVGIALMLTILAYLLKRVLSAMQLGWINRLGGLLLGGLKWVLIVSLVLNIMALFGATRVQVRDSKISQSQFYQPLKEAMPTLLPFFPKQQIQHLIDTAKHRIHPDQNTDTQQQHPEKSQQGVII